MFAEPILPTLALTVISRLCITGFVTFVTAMAFFCFSAHTHTHTYEATKDWKEQEQKAMSVTVPCDFFQRSLLFPSCLL